MGFENFNGEPNLEKKQNIPTYPKPEIKSQEELRRPTDESKVLCYDTEFALRTGSYSDQKGNVSSFFKGVEVEGDPLREQYQQKINEGENYANCFYSSAIASLDKEAGHGWLLPFYDANQVEVWTQENGDWEDGGTVRTTFNYETGEGIL